jgi:hypothetical protein
MRADVFSTRYKISSNRPNDRTGVSNTVANADAGSVGRSVSEAGRVAKRCGLGRSEADHDAQLVERPKGRPRASEG